MPTQEELILQQFGAARQNLAQQKKAGQQEMEAQIGRQAGLSGLRGGAALKAREKATKQFNEGYSGAEANLSGAQAQALQNVQAQKEQQAFQSGEAEKQRQFGSTEAEKQRTYGTSEREQSQSFSAAEALKGRQFTSEERNAIQAFQQAERLGSQDYASAEAQLGRQFTTAERQAIQDYQSGEAATQRQFQTGERLGSQQFASGEAAAQRGWQSTEADKQRANENWQFGQNLGLQYDQLNTNRDQFSSQMKFNLAELSESAKANWVNAMTAWKNAGMDANWFNALKGRLGSASNYSNNIAGNSMPRLSPNMTPPPGGGSPFGGFRL